MLNEITLGKWEDWLPKVEAQSVRLALLDMPYNTTQNDWDIIPVDLPKLWQQLKRILTTDGCVICTADQPFTSFLILSNLKWFKYTLVWDKVNPTGHLNSKIAPLPRHEDIVIFAPGRTIYNPIMRTGKYRKRESPTKHSQNYGSQRHVVSYGDQYYPTSIIEISGANQLDKFHPTQKPLKLFDNLIFMFSHPGDTVLDCFAGSGTTALSAVNQGRNFICIEQDYEYWQKATKRLELARAQGRFNFDFEETAS